VTEEAALSEHQPIEDAPALRAVEEHRRRRRRKGRMRRLTRIAAVSLLLAAVTLVAAHQVWRSAPAAGRTHEGAATALATPTASPASSSKAQARKIQVFIEHSADEQSAAQAAELATFLKNLGFPVAAVRGVGFKIHRPSVRFYFERDRPGTEALLEAIRDFFASAPGQAPDHAIDLTHSGRKPETDDVEVWLATS
jgi:hypothetical protein